MNTDSFEIERKFLIKYPDMEDKSRFSDVSEIEQTYLIPDAPGNTARVRKRGAGGVYTYTHTVKKRISDMRRIELEREISEDEYRAFLKKADPGRRTVIKTRCCLEYEAQLFEIDLYPFWQDRAVMEIELEDEKQPVFFPPDIEVIREITADRRYTNASMAKSIPEESL